jgi:hypothetical protein
MLFVALFARALAPYDPYEADYGAQFARPTPEHWFGTDEFGRDVLSRDHVWSADRAVRRLHGVARGLRDRRPARVSSARTREDGDCCWSASWTFCWRSLS